MYDEVRIPRVVVAGAHSGAGKTTVALGLVAALSGRGRTVQTFKVGPDLVDSAYLSHASRRPCRNLDAWMLGAAGLRRSLSQGTMGADCAVIEGVMGIFDGHGLAPDESRGGPSQFPGSTAEAARIARCPVILVLDVTAMAETAAAVALGIRQLDPRLHLIGVVLNEVPSDYHRRLVEDAIWQLAKLPVLGALPRLESARIPELRQSLLPLTENPHVDPALDQLGKAVERHCDLDLIERLMASAESLPPSARPLVPALDERVRLGVAFDDAFCFYYAENLELLEDAGCEIVPFSPLDERSVPRDVAGLYFGGGFSEVFAGPLSQNRPFLDSLARAQAQGMPIYAECGGALLLARSLRTGDGAVHPMAGVLPVDMAMDSAPRSGYRDLRLMGDCLLGPAGTRLRGHEFHFSRLLTATDQFRAAYSVHDCDGEPLGCEGWTSPTMVASFVQLHFGQDPEIASRLVERMRAARRLRRAETEGALV